MRYYNKYGDILLKRMKLRDFYQRLGIISFDNFKAKLRIDLNRNCQENDIKGAFRAKALVWHPDNTK